ncbi:MAG: AbrB/MazE/SpoVT family DNA-binding domain-containing protein [bacterium]
MLAKKTSKNQITLPKEIVSKFEGVDYFDVVKNDNRIILTPVKISVAGETLKGIRDKMEKLGITENDVSGGIKWARKRK